MSDKRPKPLVLRSRTFRNIWIGFTTSQIGDNFQYVAITLWALLILKSPLTLGVLAAARILPVIVLGMGSGVFADRWNKRALLIYGDFIRAAIVLGMMVCVFSRLTWLLIVLTVILATVSSVYNPGFSASLPDIVSSQDLASGTSYFQLSQSLGAVGGVVLGGLVVGAFSIYAALVVDVASYIVSGTFIVLTKFSSPRRHREPTSFKADLIEGLRWVYHRRTISVVFVLSALFSFFGSALFVLTSVAVTRVWHLNGATFGIQQAVMPLGMVLTSIVVAEKLGKSKRPVTQLMSVAFALSGFASGAALLLPNLVFASPVFFLSGIGSAIGFICLRYTVRIATPQSMQGRVFGAMSSVGNSAYPLGSIIGTALVTASNARGLTVGSGVLFGLVGLLGLLLFQFPSFSGHEVAASLENT